jgi:hypothetical protein
MKLKSGHLIMMIAGNDVHYSHSCPILYCPKTSRFYPTENIFFSCVLPKGSEAEIAGFRVISSMILSWLPPLLFSLMVSNGIDPKVRYN